MSITNVSLFAKFFFVVDAAALSMCRFHFIHLDDRSTGTPLRPNNNKYLAVVVVVGRLGEQHCNALQKNRLNETWKILLKN